MTTAAEMKERYDDPWEGLADMADENEDLKETVEEQADWIETLEKEVETQSSNVGGAHHRISELEETIEEGTPSSPPEPGIEGDETGSEDDRTPLEQVVDLPYSIAQNRLKVVDRRARYIAMSIEELGSETQKGHVIDSSIVRTALSQSDLVNGRAHTQQVSRVMDALEDLGKDDISSNIKGGKRRMAFSYEMVERISNGCCDDVQPDALPDTVMILG